MRHLARRTCLAKSPRGSAEAPDDPSELHALEAVLAAGGAAEDGGSLQTATRSANVQS